MGTRNLICVVKDNKFKLTKYCQWDGHLTGQGADIVKFIVKMNKEKSWQHFSNHLDTLVYVSDNEIGDLWAKCGARPDVDNMVPMDVSIVFSKKYPQLHRDMGGDILFKIFDNKNLGVEIIDTLFTKEFSCRYCYVLDLDDKNLEIYSQEGQLLGRFGSDIKLLCKLPLTQINEQTIPFLIKQGYR